MSVYATNRLASIAEDSEFSQEIIEAFADTSRETANLSNYGIIAQLHENDMRMFDAIISADFASVTNGKLLEGAELSAINEKMENATASKIWDKIKNAIRALKEAIVKVARLIRDKIYDLIKADKKIVDKYGKAIKDAKSIDLVVKMALPTKSISVLAKQANASYSELTKYAGDIATVLRGLDDNTPGSGDGVSVVKKQMDKIIEGLNKECSDIFNGQANSKVTKAEAEAALDELKTGKSIINATKSNADKALKVIKSVENAAKAAQSKHSDSPAAGARVYSLVSGVGASTNKAMNEINNALVRILAANRKIVLAAGRKALGGVQEAAVLDALFESSDLYVSEMCALI